MSEYEEREEQRVFALSYLFRCFIYLNTFKGEKRKNHCFSATFGYIRMLYLSQYETTFLYSEFNKRADFSND